jgi:uncharacterized protein YndB with AHSA1/START domain
MSKISFVAEPGKPEIVMVRVFEAPRERAFEAFIDAKAISQWWGPRRFTTTIEKLEARMGGTWRFVQRDAAGNAYGFHGVYHEVLAPERLVHTFEFEGAPGHVLLQTVRFKDVGGNTEVTSQAVFQSVETRDGMVKAGAEGGAIEGWDRLAELLAKHRHERRASARTATPIRR